MNDKSLVSLSDFPILSRVVHGDKRLVYLDSAATSHKPQQVIDAIVEYYTRHNANVHRGIHVLGDESTKLFHESRSKIAKFFGAEEDELILVRNTTEALNTIAYTWGEMNIGEGDVIVSTVMEHHSNLVPWQQLAKRKGAILKLISVTTDGLLQLDDLQKFIQEGKVKLIAVTHVSNAIGTKNPIEQIIDLAHEHGAVVVIDGAQSAPHLAIDFHTLNCDFYGFSGHKMLGPMGIGGLLVKRDILEKLPPFFFGGGMINEVHEQETSFADLPDRFIAGTPDVAGTVGLAAACAYLSNIGMKAIEEFDKELIVYAIENLKTVPQVKLLGPLVAAQRCGSVSFEYQGVHAHDVAQILDSEGVAVRSGHHCTMPLHEVMKCTASVRASFNVYTTTADIEVLVKALEKVKTVFGYTEVRSKNELAQYLKKIKE